MLILTSFKINSRAIHRAASLTAIFLLAVMVAGAQPGPGARGQAPPGGPGGFGGGAPATVDFNDHTGFTQIFDGRTLNGWDGAEEIWSVQDGVIVAQSTEETPAGTTFLIYRGNEQIRDFELKLEIKLEGGRGNSGIQYHSRNAEPSANFGRGRGGAGAGGGQAAGREGGPAPAAEGRGTPPEGRGGGGGGMMGGAFSAWNLQGPQADFDGNGSMSGQLFEGGRFAGERGIATRVGQVMLLQDGEPSSVLVANVADAEDIVSNYKAGDWNQYHVIVRGNTYFHILNGRLASVTIDDANRFPQGLIGLQIEGTGLTVSFRNIWLKTP